MSLSKADLPLNPDGSVYHLNLLPHEIADTILFVGDPHRATQIASHFDEITVKKQKREFLTYTGTIAKKSITVIGTGMSVGNIDIVINELDALVNVDLTTREIKKNLTSLKIVRLGTAGGLHTSIKVGSYVTSHFALGFDNLLDFYDYSYSEKEQRILTTARKHFNELVIGNSIYCAEGDAELMNLFSDFTTQGLTLTSTGFYGPQYRQVRAPILKYDLLDSAHRFNFDDEKILNLEMETSAIYGLGRLLGHRCCSISAIIANRTTNEFAEDSLDLINEMIEQALRRLV